MPNKFCRYLSNGYSIQIRKNDLTVKPCCWFDGSIPLDDNLLENRKIKFDSITDWTPACQACYDIESAGQQSLRQASFDWIGEENSTEAVSMDVYLDNTCNAACVICNESSSNLWAKEKQKIGIIPISNANGQHNINEFIQRISSLISLDNLRYVKFFGGEPLFTDTHIKFLKKIPNPSEVTVHYTTNGSMFPKKDVLDVWKDFKTIIYAASLDGVEEQFDYIRWPLRWSKVSENLIKLKNQKINNLIFRVEFTANFLNSYYYDRLENWIQDNLRSNYYGDITDVNIHPCYGGIWDLGFMPIEIKRLIFEKYPKNHIIHNLVANLPENVVDNKSWKTFVETWDPVRKNSWEMAFPELKDSLNK